MKASLLNHAFMLWRTIRALFICTIIFISCLYLTIQTKLSPDDDLISLILFLAMILALPLGILIIIYRCYKRWFRARVLKKSPQNIIDRLIKLEEYSPDIAWQLMDRFGSTWIKQKKTEEGCALIDSAIQFCAIQFLRNKY